MNKKIFKISILFLVIGVVFLAFGYNYGGLSYISNLDMNRNVFNFNKPIKKFTIELDNISSIDAEFINSNIEIRKSKNSKNYIDYFSENEKDYDIYVEKGKLNIKELNYSQSLSSKFGIDLNFIRDLLLERKTNTKGFIVYISANNLEKLEIENSKGNIDISGVDIKEIEASLNMGDCKVKNLGAYNIDIKNNLGNIEFFDLNNSRTINLENNYGNIELKNVDSKFYYLKQNLGNINLEKIGVFSKIEADVDLGNINCMLKYDDTKNYKTSIKANPSVCAVNVDREFYQNIGSSEDINSDGNSEIIIKLNSEAGNINLKKVK